MDMRPIAHIKSDFSEKFGIPRQSGLVEELTAAVVFEPEYRDPSALRGLEGFSHLWLIWEFSRSRGWSPTVRPPRLGGNKRLGVFAARSCRISSSRTQDNPRGLGRKGERVANTPSRTFPPSRGGRTVGDQLSRRAWENSQMSHRWEKPSSPRRALGSR